MCLLFCLSFFFFFLIYIPLFTTTPTPPCREKASYVWISAAQTKSNKFSALHGFFSPPHYLHDNNKNARVLLGLAILSCGLGLACAFLGGIWVAWWLGGLLKVSWYGKKREMKDERFMQCWQQPGESVLSEYKTNLTCRDSPTHHPACTWSEALKIYQTHFCQPPRTLTFGGGLVGGREDDRQLNRLDAFFGG